MLRSDPHLLLLIYIVTWLILVFLYGNPKLIDPLPFSSIQHHNEGMATESEALRKL